jgi:hypothetical protein
MTVTKTCGPGVYWLFISHQQYDGSPCGSNNGYWFTATCDAGEPPIYWLSADPETGTVPGNGTLPVTVSYNTAGMEDGVYTADLIISHTGLKKGVNVVPVTIEVGQTGNNIITIEPAPIYAFMKYVFGEEMKANIFLGGGFAGGGHVVSEIDVMTLEVSGSVATMTPAMVEILPSYEGFTGAVMKIACSMPQFIDCYPLLWDIDLYTFTVTGEFTGGTPWSQAGSLTMIGHTSGDVNFDGNINILDVTFMINYLYKGGATPKPILEVADTNGDGATNILDLARLINYLYKGGEAPTHQ